MPRPTQLEYTKQEQQRQCHRRRKEKLGYGDKTWSGIAVKTEKELPRQPLRFFPKVDLRDTRTGVRQCIE